MASVEGEEFSAEVVARVLEMAEHEVLRALIAGLSAEHRLVRFTSLRRVGEQRLSQYRLRPYLFQAYLHQRLDEAERAHPHEEVGVALEGLHAAVPRALTLEVDTYQSWAGEWYDLANPQWFGVAAVAPQLARHFQEAGFPGKEMGYLQQASERAWFLGAIVARGAPPSSSLARSQLPALAHCTGSNRTHNNMAESCQREPI